MVEYVHKYTQFESDTADRLDRSLRLIKKVSEMCGIFPGHPMVLWEREGEARRITAVVDPADVMRGLRHIAFGLYLDLRTSNVYGLDLAQDIVRANQGI